MATFLSKRTHGTTTHYTLAFDRKASPGSGYGFPCDKDGNVNTADLQPVARDSYNRLVAGDDKFEAPYLCESVSRWVEPAVIACECCGAQVSLYGFTNTCGCGSDYNMSGNLLADRGQWGEETGESPADCY